ncbi:MAG: hexose kinase [Elusimicrobia bacterium]|nr:hexose kinase [Elusimicrobiota bacterium]
MILILCLNAAVDKTVVVDRLRLRRLNRPGRVLTLPGGKGINVARVLARLGERPLVLGFTAGYTGVFIESALREEGLAARWLRLAAGQSRTCLAILHGRGGPDPGRGAPTELNEAGAVIGARDLRRLTRECGALAKRSRLVILSGSLPPGCPPGTYARLIQEVRRHGRRVFLDTSTPALKPALTARPDLVKLNRDEAASLGLPVGRPDALARALENAAQRGARDAIVTLGPAGAVAFLGGRRLMAEPPKVRSVSPVGCGDTFLAAFARETLRGIDPRRALAFATAVGTASALVPGAGVVRMADVGPILRKVRVKEL